MRQNINTDSTGEKFQQLFTWLLPAVYFLGGGLLVAFVLNFYHHQISHDPGDWGVLGDYFGGLMNPVISFATLLVAYAVWKLQRVELDETKKALKDQAETAERQRQEQRFFDLLNVYYKTVEACRFDAVTGGCGTPPNRESHYGKDAITQWISRHLVISDFLVDDGQYVKQASASDPSNDEVISSLKQQWVASDVSVRFGALLRTIETVLSTATVVLTRDQLSYFSLLKGQLSNSELSLIGLQLLFKQGSTQLNNLVEQLGLLENMAPGNLRSALQDRLPPTAFASVPSTSAQTV